MGQRVGELGLSADQRRWFRHQQLRIRTVAVSFAAAVSSARRDMDVTDAEREALIESWRTWTLGTLRAYADEIRQLGADASPGEADALQGLDDELIRAYELVREA